jgi:isopentenyl diphosphate isomerase/L-lactate dehydrogenase-like FMN-dependent dehydrogenase
MLELLEIEIRTTMGLMGITSLSQLDPSWVRRVVPCAPMTATSAYPWYEERLS